MAGNLLNIGKTGLFAAQAGLATTGHNISNANVVGYSRQTTIQSTMIPQNYGYGFVGNGTQVADIKRYSDEFLNVQVRNAQNTSSALNAYSSQIAQVDNLLADTTSGLSPALQDFFKAVQDVSSNPAEIASRQALLANGEALVARFQSMNGRLQELRDGVNSQITSNVTVINSYAQQIAQLNEQINAIGSATGGQPNDLLDARDQLVLDLNKQVKATVMRADDGSINVSIGSGQPLVMGNRTYALAAVPSATDPLRLEIGFVTGNKVTELPESAISGGELGGLMDFRANTLDPAQNELGRIAIVMGETVNAQHRLGKDASGVMGGDLFTTPTPLITPNGHNLFTGPIPVNAVVSDVTKLTASNYSVKFDGTNYSVSRLPGGPPTTSVTPTLPLPAFPQTVNLDGIDFTFTGAALPGDSYLVRPTVNGAAKLDMAITDPAKVAAAAPILVSVPGSNKGTAKVTDGVVDKNYLASPLASAVTLTFDSATGSLSGFPLYQDVTVTSATGVVTTYPGGTAAAPLATPLTIPYAAGSTINFGGISMTVSGQPADADTFVIDPNAGASRDNRNMRLIGELQAKNVLGGGKQTFQSAYAQLVGTVGNKAREVQVNAQASEALLVQASGAQQSVAGVNLDEEAAALLKYQQAYQASGKVMQIASTLFDTLLQLGH
jgi:flagellar hook-associated protein 1 FlgK